MLFQNWLKTLTVDFAPRSSRRDRRKARSIPGQVVLTQQDFVCARQVETLETRQLLSVDPVLVADLLAGPDGSFPSNFVNLNGTLFFSAFDAAQRPTITWDAVSGADTYVIYIRNLSTGADPLLLRAVTGTSFTPTSNLGIGAYDVRVRALSAFGDSSFYSQKSNFRIATPAVFTNVVLIQASTTPTLSWKPLTGAVKFDLWINNLSTGQEQVVRDTGLTGTSWTWPTDLPMGSYRAWIRGTDASGLQANWSQFADFFVLPPVTAVSPVNPTFDQTPTFTWNAVPGAVSYDLYYRYQKSGAATVVQTGISGTNFTPSADSAAGPYRWYVYAVVQGGYRSQSAPVQNFVIGGPPTVLTPQGSSADTTPTFSWTPITDAATYDLWVNRLDVVTSKIVFQTGLASTSFTPSTPLPAGNYRVWVRAISTTSQASSGLNQSI